MELGTFIREKRRELDLSLGDLAQRLQLHGYAVERQTISHWETGRNKPPLDSKNFRYALARAFSIDEMTILAEIGMITTAFTHSSEARYGADLIEHMNPDKRKFAIGILEKIAETG